MDVKSVIETDSQTLCNIDDLILQEALNISDNESLENNIILEEGVVIKPEDLKIDIYKYKD